MIKKEMKEGFNEFSVFRLYLTQIIQGAQGMLSIISDWERGEHWKEPTGSNKQDKDRDAG